MSGTDAARWVVMGRVSGLYGVRGWVKVFSYAEPREGIAEYAPLYLGAGEDWRVVEVAEARAHGKGVVLRFEGIADRDAAARLVGCDIAVRREQLPEPAAGEYYWADLIGLKVVTVEGIELGVVDHLFETGANDVVVVKGERERLIPFLSGSVIAGIDLGQRVMRVDWDPGF